MQNKNSLTLIIPLYNKESYIEKCLVRIERVFKKKDLIHSIIIVDDKSSDGSLSKIHELSKIDSKIKIVSHEDNLGKGAALKSGINLLETEFGAYIDADDEIDPQALLTGIELLIADNSISIAYGSKMHKRSKVNYPLNRVVLSKVFRQLIKLLFELDVEDTQTGIKVFKTGAIVPISRQVKSNGFAFDLELMIHCNNAKLKVVPFEIELDHNFDSSINLKSIIRMAKEITKIYISIKKSK